MLQTLKINKKWYHYLFWIAYFSFWLIISGGLEFDNIVINLIYVFFSIVSAYINLYFLMPKYLYPQRYITYFSSLILNIALFSALLGFTLFGYFSLNNLNVENFFTFPQIIGPTIGAISTTVVLLMVAKLVKNLVVAEQRNRDLELEKVETELKYLKSQLNPHFLFNALNNIYFLIKKDQDKAAENLAKFSDMMRYQLYECNAKKIPLKQELTYLQNYVEVISLGKTETTDINIVLQDCEENIEISPLLLLPLIENSFKHVEENLLNKKFIDINIELKNNELICETKNSIDSETEKSVDKSAGGIGMQNLMRRLSLLYPNKHNLNIKVSDEMYVAKLNVELC